MAASRGDAEVALSAQRFGGIVEVIVCFSQDDAGIRPSMTTLLSLVYFERAEYAGATHAFIAS